MAKTLLDGVNDVLTKAQIVSNNNLLTSLTHSGKQVFVDNAVQAWNEAIDELYVVANKSKPLQMDESQITLVADQREYSLRDDLVRLHWPLQDETNGWFIYEHRGGFEELRASQWIPANYTGIPHFAAIRPDTGKLYLDRVPQSGDAGRVFKYIYDKDLELDDATDSMPFNNQVYRSMVPVVFELYRSLQHNRENDDKKKINFGKAARYLNRMPMHDSYIRRGVNSSSWLNPYDA